MSNRFKLFTFIYFLLHGAGISNAQTPAFPSFITNPSSSSFAGKNISIQTSSAYGQLSLYFEPNQGQADPQVKFISRGPGYTLFLTTQEAVLALGNDSSSAVKTKSLFFSRGRRNGIPSVLPQVTLLRMKPVGTVLDPPTEGLEPLLGISNYFIGKDPAQWRTNITQYAKVRVKGIYPGIDMVYYGNQRQLEYDFVASPGADIKSIRLSYEGALGTEINVNGELLLRTAGGNVVFKSPAIYQNKDGARQPVKGRYKLTGSHEVGFEVDSYDTTKPLVIDPVLDYSTYLGGNGHDGTWGVAVDSAGDAYVIGHSISPNFPVTNALQPVIAGTNYNAIVAKLNPTGTALIYSTFLGGTGNEDVEFPYGIAVDGGGNCYVAGPTSSQTGAPGSNDFPITPGTAYQTTSPGGSDAFVTELNPSGSGLVYSTYFGGTGDDFCFGLALDPANGVYVTGQSFSTDLPTTGAGGGSAYQNALKSLIGSCNGFIAKLDTTKTGTASLVYSTYLGGGSADTGIDIAADPAGNAYVVGWGNSPDFPTTPGAPQTVNHGGFDAFITKLNPSGTSLVYSTLLGGSGDENLGGIAVDAGGNAYVAGDTTSIDFPTTSGAPQTVRPGTDNAFVTKLNPSGTAWAYSTYLGGSNYDIGYDVKVNGSGEAYVVGSSASSNFPTTSDAYQLTYIGGGNAMGFLTHLNALGTGLVYSTYFGGSGGDALASVALDGNNGIYLAGETISTDLPTTSGAPQTVFGGGPADGFVAKFGPSPTSTPTITDTPTITNTPTITATPTITPTKTNTFTPTLTSTTTSTFTMTRTPTVTETPTPTTTPSFTGGTSLWPNPNNGTGFLNLSYSLTQAADSVQVKVFTTAFRRVFLDPSLATSSGNHIYVFDLQSLNFADGLYYVILEVETGGKKDRHVLKELILK